MKEKDLSLVKSLFERRKTISDSIRWQEITRKSFDGVDEESKGFHFPSLKDCIELLTHEQQWALQSHILPMLYSGLKTTETKLQELGVELTPTNTGEI